MVQWLVGWIEGQEEGEIGKRGAKGAERREREQERENSPSHDKFICAHTIARAKLTSRGHEPLNDRSRRKLRMTGKCLGSRSMKMLPSSSVSMGNRSFTRPSKNVPSALSNVERRVVKILPPTLTRTSNAAGDRIGCLDARRRR